MIIHICGMPGVGKFTIAKELRKIISGRLIDNHLIVDLSEAVCDRDHPDYRNFLDEIVDITLARLKERKKDSFLIFTNALAAELEEDRSLFEKYHTLAKEMGRPFVPVLITCKAEENAKRLIQEDRKRKGKLRDTEILNSILSRYTPMHFHDHPNALSIENTDLSAKSTAEIIATHCRGIEIANR